MIWHGEIFDVPTTHQKDVSKICRLFFILFAIIRIPSDIKDAAFCTGIRYSADEGDVVKMLALYKSTKTYSEKASALNALACAKKYELLKR